MICKECNTKNENEANFCSECGKTLKQNIKTQNVDSIKMIAKNFVENIKGMFLKPVTTAKAFIKENNYMTSLLYISFNIIVMAIMVLILMKLIFSKVANSLGGGYSGLGLGYGSLSTSLEIPYFKIFVIAIMIGIITYVLLAGVAYLTSAYLFKSKTSFKLMTTWLGINSVLNTSLLVVVAIVAFISIKLCLILYLIGEVLYSYNLFKSLEFATDVDENKLGYVLLPTMLITLFVLISILPELFF